MEAMRIEIVRIHLLRWHGYYYADETAIAIGAIRLEISPIHFLRQLGYEGAEETAAASPPVSAVFVGSPSP